MHARINEDLPIVIDTQTRRDRMSFMLERMNEIEEESEVVMVITTLLIGDLFTFLHSCANDDWLWRWQGLNLAWFRISGTIFSQYQARYFALSVQSYTVILKICSEHLSTIESWNLCTLLTVNFWLARKLFTSWPFVFKFMSITIRFFLKLFHA